MKQQKRKRKAKATARVNPRDAVRSLNAAWQQRLTQTLFKERRKFAAKYMATQTTPGMKRHWQFADALSAREANSLAVRKKLRERVRFEFDNNGDLQGICLTSANQFIGPDGPKLQSATPDEAINKAIDHAFNLWATVARLHEELWLMKLTKIISGEPFGILRYNPAVNHPVKLGITTVEPDQCTAPMFQATWDKSYVDGIRFDPLGNPISYDILREHPGDGWASTEYDTLPASRVLHWFSKRRPGQVRGVPEIHAAITLAALRGDVQLDVAFAYRMAALFGVVLESSGPAGEDEPGTGTEAGGHGEVPDLMQVELARGMMTELPKNMKATTVKPEHPTTNHQSFDRGLLRGVARPLCMPYHMAAGDYSDSNYATARLGAQDFRVAIGRERSDCESEVLDRILAAFLREAVLIPGLLPPAAKAYVAALPHLWQWPRWDHIDPQTDATADGARLEHGSASLADIRPDWRTLIRQQVQEEAYRIQVRNEMGLGPVAQADVPPAVAAAAPPETRSLPASIKKRLGVQIRANAKKPALRLNAGAESITFGATKAKPPALKQFSMLAYTGGSMMLPGFESHPSVVDLAGVTIAAGNLPVLLDHRGQLRVGHTTSVVNDGKQITATGIVSGTSPAAREVVQTSVNEFPWQASIGGEILETEFLHDGQTATVNGQAVQGPAYIHRKTILREISFVPLGADRGTAAKIAAALGGSAMTFEQWILGFMTIDEYTAMDDAAKEVWQTVFEKTGGGGDPPADDPAAAAAAAAGATLPPVTTGAAAGNGLTTNGTRRRTPARTPGAARNQLRAADAPDVVGQMRVETARQQRIRNLAAGYKDVTDIEVAGKKVNLVDHAILEGWDEAQTSQAILQALRASNSSGPFGYTVSSKPNLSGEILEAAMCKTLTLPNIEKHFKPEVLEAADRNFKAIGLQQVLLLAANQNGYQAGPGERIHMHNIRSVLRYAFPPRDRVLQAAWTPISLPGVFSNTANKEILEGYTQDEGPWRDVAGIGTVSDFKSFTSYRLLDNMEYEEVGPGGEIPHGKLDEESYTRQAKTYAKMLVLTLQAIVNDDLGAFNVLRTILGAGAMLKLRKVFWTEFMSAASTFWTAARTNYIEGATTNLGTDGVGLGLGVKAFRQMRSPSGDGSKYIAGKPEILLVPPELETNADAYYQNRNYGAGTSVANANTHQAKYKPVVVPELSDSTYTGNSATAWFLLRNPAIAAAVVVSFLDGQQTPVIEDTDADFNVLGVQFRGYHHFGADQAEYLCGVKSKGSA